MSQEVIQSKESGEYNRLLSASTLLVLLVLVGCTMPPEPTLEAAGFNLNVKVIMDINGEIVLRFGAHNMEMANIPGDNNSAGMWLP